MKDNELIVCRDVSLGYEGKSVLTDLNLTIAKGDYLCVVGDNGSGKSTLIRGLLGLIQPQGGTIEHAPALKHGAIGYLPQQTRAQRDFPATVLEVVLSGCLNRQGLHFFYTPAQRSEAMMNLGKLGMLELKDELKDLVDIQIVAFPQEGIQSYPNGEQLVENAVKMGADCVGAIPHFEFTREYAVESVNFCMKIAEKYGRLVDVHCDEIDDEQSKGLEVLACRALESGMKDMVTASHTTAMHSYNNAYCGKLFRLLGMSDINFVCNPLVNTHLQGRFDTYPKRRGVTRVKELLANGNNVSFGHDDIFDPWYPLGDGNMRDVIHMGLHVCQMMGYQEIMDSYKFCTYNAARTLHLGDKYGIREGNPASFILLNNNNFYNALNQKSEVLYSYNRGRLIASTTPAEKKALF